MTLAEIFGDESRGDDAASRALTSGRIFVRSHMQLALASEGVTGRRLTAHEALEAYGIDLIEKVVTEGGAGLITDAGEPARTFSHRRRTMRLSKRTLAQAAAVSIDDITAAETPGEVSSFRTLEKIAQALALDERKIGLAGLIQGDRALGIRLRELNQPEERNRNFVAALADAAWVIARQTELSRRLNADRDASSLFHTKSSDYDAPVWRKGYELAERTRKILKLGAAPIGSIYALAQDTLGIPVVDIDLGDDVAGATILNGGARGIVLNRQGANRNILVRRMTIAHELGHLLWDPDDQLERVRVDESADLNRRNVHDVIEARANAFAVAFLAPRQAVRQLYEERGDIAATVASLVENFGISASAAAQHLANVCAVDLAGFRSSQRASTRVVSQWDENERQSNLITEHVPPSRGNRFAQLTIQAVRKKFITEDTAVSWLKIDRRYLADLF
jgi:Zn-dependent peptidase ImmA (M78 family)